MNRDNDATSIHVSISRDLKKRVKVLLMDPTTGGFEYGSLSELITRLLEGWIMEEQYRYLARDVLEKGD